MREAAQLRVHEVSDSANYRHYSSWCHCLVAEPKKYLGTHLLFWAALALYGVATAPLTPLPLIVTTALLAALVQILLIALAFADPGILPKILPSYERPDLNDIPLRREYYREEMRDVQIAYCFPTGTHSLRVKFCNSCFLFRPARTSHCYDCNSCV